MNGEISRHNAPNFDFRGRKGLHLRWGMHKRVPTFVPANAHKRRPYTFSRDNRQIFRHGEYLSGGVA